MVSADTDEKQGNLFGRNPDVYNDLAYGHVAVLYHPRYRSPSPEYRVEIAGARQIVHCDRDSLERLISA
jgi:hypothetical protein